MTPPLWEHQKRGVDLLTARPANMLAWDMGVGKTRTAIVAAERMDCRRVLVVCPKTIVQVWEEQIPQWSNIPLVVGLGSDAGSIRVRAERMTAAFDRLDAQRVAVITNYDAIWREPLASAVLNQKWDMVICDESHAIKTARAKRSRYFCRFTRSARHRVCLTGTPMAHSPLDVYGQYRFLDPTIYGYTHKAFRAQYCTFAQLPPKRNARGELRQRTIPVELKNLDDLHRKFRTIADVVRKRDVLDLPPTIHETRTIDLSPSAQKAYRELESDFSTRVGRGEINPANALVQLLRLRQMTGGIAALDAGGQVRIDESKNAALVEELESIAPDERVVVFCNFHADLDSVHVAGYKTGRKTFELSGRQANTLKAWRDTPGAIFAVQMQTGAQGIDLTAACYCIYYSIGFSLSEYEQSVARLDRPGQTRSVTYTHLLARGTIDETVYYGLGARRDLIRYCIDGIGKPKIRLAV